MTLLSFDQVSIDFGEKLLLDGVNLTIEKGQKLALIGRNGEGKSTILRIMAGQTTVDGGEVMRRDGLIVAMMAQFADADSQHSIEQYLYYGLGKIGEVLFQYQQALVLQPDDPRLADWQHTIEAAEAWSYIHEVESVISRLQLQKEMRLSELSGGLKRRVNLARALVQQPDILLLDEPTNHLDIETIIWLQKLLQDLPCALVFVTHDRAFLQAVANGVIELDRGHLYSYDCDYHTYLRRREERLSAELMEWERADKKLTQEEIWVRQGVKARRTRSKKRVEDLELLRTQRRERRTLAKDPKAAINMAEASGKKVMVAHKISYAYTDVPLVEDFSSKIFRGDKVGIIGPNGVGKTTLVKLLTGELQPQQGSVKLGTGLELAYFDQMKQSIDPNLTVQENLLLGTDFVDINGKSRHVISYLQDFLFSAEKIRSPASVLSGGEQSRLLLARLFARPANVLVLDEPTNDLDMESLDLLQDLLMAFDGTVLLISHDRDFLDQVATQTLVFEKNVEGQYHINEYVGGYEDYLRQRPKIEATKTEQTTAKSQAGQPQRAKGKQKLTYNLKRELQKLPQEIEKLELQVADLTERMCASDFYQQDQAAIQKVTAECKQKQDELQKKYSRWDELESLENS
ncbi:ATP-binding cassette domain-containing protein [Marinicella sp. W31]|uniref:ATP-binding cassette domain-containing protein n=1 Tax=Marinicella sp. W31 TaxID=3023713 RepID=UPI0037579749